MYNPPVRALVLFVVFALAVALVILGFSEIETIVSTLRQAQPAFVLLGVLVQLAWFVVLGRMYQSVFHLLNLKESIMSLIRIGAAANFVNVVAPSAGMGGVAVFAAEARRRGHPSGRATAAAALFFLFDQAAFLAVLALGLLVLLRRNGLSAAEIVASSLLIVIASIYAFILYVGYRSERRLGLLLAGIARALNRMAHQITRHEYLSEDRALEFAHELSDGLASVRQKPRQVVVPILWGLCNKLLLMGVLLCAFLSFDVSFSAGTIIAGFALTYLFYLISPTPSGIGFVEALMPVALNSLRVDWSQAVIVTLIYRGLTFWLPLGIGALAFRSLHRRTAPLPT